jgi:hypothetical protein
MITSEDKSGDAIATTNTKSARSKWMVLRSLATMEYMDASVSMTRHTLTPLRTERSKTGNRNKSAWIPRAIGKSATRTFMLEMAVVVYFPLPLASGED